MAFESEKRREKSAAAGQALLPRKSFAPRRVPTLADLGVFVYGPGMIRLLSILAACALASAAVAQDAEPVQIKREPIAPRPVDEYQIPLALEPVRTVTLRAAVDGTVEAVLAELGKDALDQADLVRFDSKLARLELERAEAAAAANYPTEAIAAVDEKIARLKLERMAVRAPFAGQVVAVHVAPGAMVTAGTPLLDLADMSALRVRVPVQRGEVNVGDRIPVRVESQTVDGTIEAILPAGEQIGKLRPLFESLAEAVVEVPGNSLVAGQTVYSDLIPRDPIAEVPSSALETTDDGGRAVFVLRSGYAAAVPVMTLGQVGRDRLYVSGRFAAGDEVVTESSQPLVDGARVIEQAMTEGGGAQPQQGGSRSVPSRQPARRSTF